MHGTHSALTYDTIDPSLGSCNNIRKALLPRLHISYGSSYRQ